MSVRKTAVQFGSCLQAVSREKRPSKMTNSMTVPMKNVLHKTPTGIEGLDEITNGGLPTGRTTLVCGTAGSGKTVFGLEFLVNGIVEYGEPGVFMAFEETEKDLAENVASLGVDLERLQSEGKLAVDYVAVERSQIQETGEYNLDGLFVRLSSAVEAVKAKRVVLDTIEVLFAGLHNHGTIRSELRRLFRWLKDRGLTAVVTGERGEGMLTRYGLEEYVADCVIVLDHRVIQQISTRRLRVVKYRGSLHGSDEYPFLLGEGGISVLPLTSVGLTHPASMERISSGVAAIDAMLDGKGFFRGSSILVSGTPGVGKSSLAMTFLKAACERGESALYCGFEESVDQIVRNMGSIGLDLRPWIERGLLHFHTVRPSSQGLESHLAAIHRITKTVAPRVVAMDPITNFISVSEIGGVKSMLTRLVDSLKMQEITTMFTHLTSADDRLEATDESLSSIMDSWLLLRDVEYEGLRSGALYVLKSRGMPHSRELREFQLTNEGISLREMAPRHRPRATRSFVSSAAS
jgi:circadian clock protein KaiC